MHELVLFFMLATGVPAEAVPPTYTIAVFTTSDEPLEGAQIVLVGDKEEVLATSDAAGIASFASAKLQHLKTGALLVCHPGYYCAGWKLSEPNFTSRDQWLNIEVAPVTLR